jgi:hypothetical protein
MVPFVLCGYYMELRCCLCRWLVSHGLRLAVMTTLESPEVTGAFGKAVQCACEHGKAQAVGELCEKNVISLPTAEVPGYNPDAYDDFVLALESLKHLEFSHIAQVERNQDHPISDIMQGLTLARHMAEGAESLPDFYLKPDAAQLQVPVFVQPRDTLNPYILEKEVPLQEALGKHAERAAMKKGVKDKFNGYIYIKYERWRVAYT